MAKGFTVKAAAPTPKTEDWDYVAIKEEDVLLSFSKHLYNFVLI
jgi:hypothetical protein